MHQPFKYKKKHTARVCSKCCGFMAKNIIWQKSEQWIYSCSLSMKMEVRIIEQFCGFNFVSNIFAFDFTERELLTPPLNGLILPGITRNSILSLVQQWGDFKVTEGSITMSEVTKMIKEERVCTLSDDDPLMCIEKNLNIFVCFFRLQLLEMFGAGTACIVCPINRINYMGSDLLIPTVEHEKPLFARIKDTLSDIQYGRIEHPWAVLIDWATTIRNCSLEF